MVLQFDDIRALLRSGVVEHAKDEAVNGTSLDIHLGPRLLVEQVPEKGTCPTCKGHFAFNPGHRCLLAEQRGGAVAYTCSLCQRTHVLSSFVGAIDLSTKEPLTMHPIDLGAEGEYVLQPGEAILAESVEVFHLPLHITAEYRLKSSQARCFLEHLHAGWCDPGWNGSVLTMELVNMSRYHPLLLRQGMRIGQMAFYEHDPVPVEHSYRARGQYNGMLTVAQSGGIR